MTVVGNMQKKQRAGMAGCGVEFGQEQSQSWLSAWVFKWLLETSLPQRKPKTRQVNHSDYLGTYSPSFMAKRGILPKCNPTGREQTANFRHIHPKTSCFSSLCQALAWKIVCNV